MLSVITPYAAYWLPQYLGGSGVLATVAAGLYVSWRGPLLIGSSTRLQGIFFWDLIIYVIEGFVFLLTGLEARALIASASSDSWLQLLAITLLTTAVLVVARFVWMFPATYLSRWLIPAVARRDPSPPWQFPFMLAFTGVRGVVSLAAALSIPLTLTSGAPFPDRDLIVVITFGVIITTLVGLGSTMPMVIGWLGLARGGAEERRKERESEARALVRNAGGGEETAASRGSPPSATCPTPSPRSSSPTTRPFAASSRRTPPTARNWPRSTTASAAISLRSNAGNSTACWSRAASRTNPAAASSGSSISRRSRWPSATGPGGPRRASGRGR